MKTWVRKSLSVGILAAAALLFAPGAAHADATPSVASAGTSAGSTQNYSPITVPVNLNGTSLGNLGGSTINVGLTESAKTTQSKKVAPAVAGIGATESATGGHDNGNGFCGSSLHFLGGGPSFRCGGRFHGHGGHRHGGAFLGDSIGDFDDIGFYGDDFDGDDLFLGDFDDPDGDDQFQDDQDLTPSTPVKGNGSSDGYGNVSPATGNGNAAPTTGGNDGYGNASPTTGSGTPTTGDLTPTTGDVSPTTGDLPPTTGGNAGYGDVSPTKPTKPTVKPVKPVKPVKHKHTKPAVKPITSNGDTTGYGDVSPATGSNSTTDGGRATK